MNRTAAVANSTGVEGLDLILQGGLVPARTYLVEGTPGAGKTTLAMQFLLEGLRREEKCLYVTLSERKYELEASAQTHGWSLDGIEIREYIISDASIERDKELTMFHSSEVELGETMARILRDIETFRPRRAVI